MRRLLWSLLGFVLIVTTLLTLLFTTQAGLKIGISLINSVSSINISYQKLDGPLIGPITADKLTIKTDDSDWEIQQLTLNWSPLYLLTGTIHINSLISQQATGTLHPTQDSSDDSSSFGPSVVVNNATINQLTMKFSQHAEPVHINNINWSGHFAGDALQAHLTVGEIPAYLQSAKMTIDGTSHAYKVELTTKLPYADLHLAGQGDINGMQVNITPSPFGHGHIQGHVKVTWNDGWNWQGQIDGKKIGRITNAPAPLPQINHIYLKSSGHWSDEKQLASWQANIDSPSGKIKTQGRYDSDHWSINWNIKQAQLKDFYPPLKGILNSHGSWNHGKTQGQLQLTRGHWSSWKAKSIAATWQGNASAETIDKLQLNFSNLQNNIVHLKSGQLSITTKNQHNIIDLNVVAHKSSWGISQLHTKILIAHNKNSWSGSWQSINLKTNAGSWKLKQATNWLWQPSKWKQHTLCLLNRSARFCVLATGGHSNDWSIAIKSNNFPLHNWINRHLTSMSSLRALGNVAINIEKKPDQPITGKMELKVPSAHLRYQEDGQPIAVNLQNITASAKLEPKLLTINSRGRWGKRNHWKLRSVLFKKTNKSAYYFKPNQTIFSLHADDLKVLNALSSSFDVQSGRLDANLRAHGSLAKPHFTGNIDLVHGRILLTDINNPLANLTAHFRAANDELSFHIRANTSTAPITINGRTQLKQFPDHWPTQLNLSANNALLTNTEEYTATFSPNINASIDDHVINLSGNVLIPSADIKPINFSSAVTLPSDVIIVGATPNSDNRWRYTMSLAARLGNDVKIKTQGATGKLTGHLQLQKTLHTPLQGKGSIYIKNGKLDVYGINLFIDPTSNVSYLGGPLNNPILNIKIYRKITTGGFTQSRTLNQGDLIVGIMATGPYLHLKPQLYSSPVQLSQTDILSYLAFGHPGSSTSPLNVASILSMLSAMPSSGGSSSALSKILNIQQTLGFTELGVQSNTTLDALGTPLGIDEEAFVVGRYLTPNIYLRYTRGITSQLNIMQVRYLINNNWSVQMESGQLVNEDIQGVDVLYSFTHIFNKKKK